MTETLPISHEVPGEVHPTTPPENPTHVETRYIPTALNTHNAVEKQLAEIVGTWINGPERGRSKFRTLVVPAVSAFLGGEIAKPLIEDAAAFTHAVTGPFIGAELALAGSAISLATRRALGSERFPQLFTRMAIKKGERNIFKRIGRGLESWWVKKVMFNKNREMKELLSFVDKEGNFDENRMNSRTAYSKDRWKKYIFEGLYKGANVHALENLEPDLSEGDDKNKAEMEIGFRVAQKLLQTKLTDAEQHNFLKYEVEPWIHKRETKDYIKAGVGITGASMVKAATLVSAVEVFNSETVRSLAQAGQRGVDSFTSQLPVWVDKTRNFITDRIGEVTSSIQNFAHNFKSPWEHTATPTILPEGGGPNHIYLPSIIRDGNVVSPQVADADWGRRWIDDLEKTKTVLTDMIKRNSGLLSSTPQ